MVNLILSCSVKFPNMRNNHITCTWKQRLTGGKVKTRNYDEKSQTRVHTRLFTNASAECSSFDLKQFWHFALWKMLASNLRHLLSIITVEFKHLHQNIQTLDHFSRCRSNDIMWLMSHYGCQTFDQAKQLQLQMSHTTHWNIWPFNDIIQGGGGAA